MTLLPDDDDDGGDDVGGDDVGGDVPATITVDEEAKLLPGDGTEYDRFGGAVAIDGDTAVVGADRHGHNVTSGSGSA